MYVYIKQSSIAFSEFAKILVLHRLRCLCPIPLPRSFYDHSYQLLLLGVAGRPQSIKRLPPRFIRFASNFLFVIFYFNFVLIVRCLKLVFIVSF